MMRVAMLVNGFPEMSEKFIVNQVVGLLDAGVDVDVFASKARPAEASHVLAEQYRLRDRTKYLGVPQSMARRFLELPARFAAGFAAGPRAAIRSFDFFSYASAAKNLKALFFLGAFRGKRYDVLHCQFGPNGLIGAFLKDCGFCERLVVTFHGSDINSYPARYGEGVYRTLYDRADRITAGSEFIRGKLVSNGCPVERISLLPMGIRSEDYPETPFEARSPLLLLSVGRLAEVKGYEYALRAFALIRQSFPEAEYFIVGEGSYRARLELLAKDLGIDASVRFLGAKSDVDVAALYRQASVFLLAGIRASDGAEEGQGLVIQEAQAGGLPVVASRVGGVPEGLRDGETGFLAPQRDHEALARLVIRLFSDDEMRKRMGEAARNFALANYDSKQLSKRLMALYKE